MGTYNINGRPTTFNTSCKRNIIMVNFFTEIPFSLVPWIQEQKIFWVATTPLSSSGHINLSQKGYEGTFNIAYSFLSGIETIAHLKENRRMTIMLTTFKGPPRIVLLFGIGNLHIYFIVYFKLKVFQALYTSLATWNMRLSSL